VGDGSVDEVLILMLPLLAYTASHLEDIFVIYFRFAALCKQAIDNNREVCRLNYLAVNLSSENGVDLLHACSLL
jgi:hypothetical protein